MSVGNLSSVGKKEKTNANKIYNYSIRDAGQIGLEGFYSCYISFDSAIDFLPNYHSNFINNYIMFLEGKGEYSSVEQFHTPCNGQLTTGTFSGNTVTITNVDEINNFALYKDISNNKWVLNLYQYQPQVIGNSIYSNPVQIASIDPSFIEKFVQGV